MSGINRRANRSNERYNRLLRLADLDPVTFQYYRDIEEEFGKFLDGQVKEEFLTSISMMANLRILTEGIRKRQGVIYGHTFTLVVGQPVRIDFMDPHNNLNTTISTLATRQALYGIHITNKGSGDLLYSLNTMNDNGSAMIIANAPTKTFIMERPTFEVLNMQATGNNAVVNIAVEL